VVGGNGGEIGERLARALVDQPARLPGGLHPRAEAAEPLFHLDRRESVAEQLLRLYADRAVARDEQDGDAPVTAERRVDSRLAHERPVEAEALPRLARDRMGQDAVRRACHRMHADEERSVAAGFEEGRVLRPFLLDDVLAGWLE